MLTQLGNKTPLPNSPEEAILEVAPWHGARIFAQFDCPEWSGLCPVTGQPDYGHIVIDYIPKAHLIESKSLKLFLGSFRNHGCFHEAVVDTIGERLFDVAKPHWLRVSGFFNARGGIAINAIRKWGHIPPGITIPEIGWKR
jgi:7-cyano-7-deazaguanine reductase